MRTEAKEWISILLLIVVFWIVIETPRGADSRDDVRASSGLDLSL